MRWTFVIPQPDLFPSGGNIYNRNIIRSLENLGEEVTIAPWSEDSCPNPLTEITVWDTIYLEAIHELDFRSWPGRHILLLHHLSSMYPGPPSVFDKLERPLLDKMYGYWVTSSFSQRYLLDREIMRPIWVMPPIFNGPRITTPVIKDDTLYVLMATNLIERKGVLPFLQLLSAKNNLKDFSISITGSHELEPEYARSCIQFVDSCWLKHTVTFLGPISRNEVFTLYQQADLFVSASFFETFGMSIQESLYYGTPVLGIDGGNTSYLVGSNGWCVPDLEQLVNQFEMLVTNRHLLKKKEVNYINWVEDWDQAAAFLLEQMT